MENRALCLFPWITAHISLLINDSAPAIWIVRANVKLDKEKRKYCLLLTNQTCVCLRLIGRWREKHVFVSQRTHHPISAILSVSVALWASRWCDAPNCCWQEADHVQNNCISTAVSYICYTTLLSVNCGYDTCGVSGVVLARSCCQEATRSIWTRKAEGSSALPGIKRPIGSSHHSWPPIWGEHPRCGFLYKY